ncbi:hypothetical protein LUZ63_013782 [Rhynchospora breviuscula]|uniref:3'-5' exonuclease domain-containing protein n=1 Tax=Rhynchospora breviuscula TaxID=2022672 RepID=A0A9Q0C981_9POAL|nr:hypothetical protein LUZ63_013782 [Rhynchospora breviuscula]
MGIYYNEDDSTYTVTIRDDVITATFTASGEVAADWVDDILYVHRWRLDRLIVGLDLKWYPREFCATKGENSVALLQLCVGRCSLLFQLFSCDFIPDKLRNFLEDDRFLFVGVGVKKDAEKLQLGYGIKVRKPVDLRELAAVQMERPEMSNWRLKNVVYEVMGVQIEKPKKVKLSNWVKRLLSHKQIMYAAIDVFVSFEVAGGFMPGNSEGLCKERCSCC